MVLLISGDRLPHAQTLSAYDGGVAALIAPGALGSAVITAHLGKALLSSGNRWKIDFYGDNLLGFALEDRIASSLVGNELASNSIIELTPRAAKLVLDQAINMKGFPEARGFNSGKNFIDLNPGLDTAIKITGRLIAKNETGPMRPSSMFITAKHVTHAHRRVSSNSPISMQ